MNMKMNEPACAAMGLATLAVLTGIWLLSGFTGSEAGHVAIVVPWIRKALSSGYAVASVFIVAEFVIPALLGLIVVRRWTIAVPALALLAVYLVNTILNWDFDAFTVNGGLFEFIGVWLILSLFAALACSGGIYLRHELHGGMKR